MTRNETVDVEVTSPSCDGAVNPRRVQELLSGFVMQPADYTDLETSDTELRKEGGKKHPEPLRWSVFSASVMCVLATAVIHGGVNKLREGLCRRGLCQERIKALER